MACDINGSGCKVCPGMWIAGIMLLVILFQSWFSRPTATENPSLDSTTATQVSNPPARN